MFKKIPLNVKIIGISMLILIIFYFLVILVVKFTLDSRVAIRVNQHRDSIVKERKVFLESIVGSVYNLIYDSYFEYSSGRKVRKSFMESDLEKRLLEEIKRIKYKKYDVYFFIIDTEKPFPRMIMDSVSPKLDGQILNSPAFNTVGKENKNLFVAMREICEKGGDGFIEHVWPREGREGLYPKISYVKLFKPLGWIIGTGIYMYDIELVLQSYRTDAEKESNIILGWVTFITAAVIILMIFLVALLVGRLIKPLNDTVFIIKGITEGKGDLTKRIDIRTNDEIGILATYFNAMIENLNNDILQIQSVLNSIKLYTDSSDDVMENEIKANLEQIKKTIQQIDKQTENSSSGVEEVTAALEEMTRSIESIMNNMVKQASAVEEGASSIEEMARNIENTATMSQKNKDISNDLHNVAVEGSSAVKDSIRSIKEVSDYSQQILKLLGLISNIARQTNLLAMNAAIEAAHAGEAGKGFAIVADEIRRLSEDTNKNARDISDVVSNIIGRIDESVRLAEKAGLGLDMITAYSQQNVQIINQLSIAISEQNNGAKEILKATQDLVRITEEVKMAITEQKQSTEDLNAVLRNLRDMTLSNKEYIKSHITILNGLFNSLEKVRDIIQKSQKETNSLQQFVNKFVLEENKKDFREPPTGLKLVE